MVNVNVNIYTGKKLMGQFESDIVDELMRDLLRQGCHFHFKFLTLRTFFLNGLKNDLYDCLIFKHLNYLNLIGILLFQ